MYMYAQTRLVSGKNAGQCTSAPTAVRRCARCIPPLVSREPLCRHCPRGVPRRAVEPRCRKSPTVILLAPSTTHPDTDNRLRTLFLKPLTGQGSEAKIGHLQYIYVCVLSMYYCAQSVSVSDGVDPSSFPGRRCGVGRQNVSGNYLRFTVLEPSRNGILRFIILRGGSPLQEIGEGRPPPTWAPGGHLLAFLVIARACWHCIAPL